MIIAMLWLPVLLLFKGYIVEKKQFYKTLAQDWSFIVCIVHTLLIVKLPHYNTRMVEHLGNPLLSAKKVRHFANLKHSYPHTLCVRLLFLGSNPTSLHLHNVDLHSTPQLLCPVTVPGPPVLLLGPHSQQTPVMRAGLPTGLFSN